eukprot:1906326-Prymnesium_polylepis.2
MRALPGHATRTRQRGNRRALTLVHACMCVCASQPQDRRALPEVVVRARRPHLRSDRSHPHALEPRRQQRRRGGGGARRASAARGEARAHPALFSDPEA